MRWADEAGVRPVIPSLSRPLREEERAGWHDAELHLPDGIGLTGNIQYRTVQYSRELYSKSPSRWYSTIGRCCFRPVRRRSSQWTLLIT